jgi:hypothetical protein
LSSFVAAVKKQSLSTLFNRCAKHQIAKKFLKALTKLDPLSETKKISERSLIPNGARAD